MKAFIFHCWGGDSRGCWRGWLADELQERGWDVIAPDFPDTMEPHLDAWLKAARERVGTFDGSYVLFAHSLGCPTILRLLESFREGEKVKAVYLVAAFAKDLGIPEIRDFVDRDFDYDKIREGAGEFYVINSDDDPFIPLEEGRRLAEALGAKLIIEHGGGHINEGSGHTSYPRLLELLGR